MSLKNRLLKQWIDFLVNIRPRAVGPGDAADERETSSSTMTEHLASTLRASAFRGCLAGTGSARDLYGRTCLSCCCSPGPRSGPRACFSSDLNRPGRRRLKRTVHMRDDMPVQIFQFQDWFSKGLPLAPVC